MTRPLMFVGERRSPTAIRKGWKWEDGHLAAKPLFEALEAMGVDPAKQMFVNLWADPPLAPAITKVVITTLRAWSASGKPLVALGQRVSTELSRRGIDHVALVHPAARGAIRKRERYVAHVHEQLGRRIHVRCGLEDESDSYVFHIETKRGLRRVWPPGYEGRGEAAACPATVLEPWLKKLRVTHVVSKFGETKTSRECIKDGAYSRAAYVRWWKRAEKSE
jgi:hypothetical protein